MTKKTKETIFLERYLTNLLDGDRDSCRTVIEESLQSGMPVNAVYMNIVWPMMVEIEKLYKADKINAAEEAFATRINRTIVDQLQNKLPRKPQRNKKIIICSSSNEQEELGAQMVSDLFESDGWESRFLGGKVNNDDILSYVHSYQPDILLVYGMSGKEAPQVRQLIDSIRSINAYPDMKIMLSGGVFNRAEGLWEEIGADMHASDAAEAVRTASAKGDQESKPQRTIKRRRKKQAPVTEEIPNEAAAV